MRFFNTTSYPKSGSGFGCAASEGRAPFVARRAMNLHGCALPHCAPRSSYRGGTPAARSSYWGAPPPAAAPPEGWIGELATLRDLFPSASPDLSDSAVARWPAYAGATCPRCGAFSGPDPPLHPAPCGLCSADPPSFAAARSLFAYAGDVRAAIVAAKYAGRPYPVRAVALRIRESLAGPWRDLFPDGGPPTVVPVPANPWKYFRRGFNLPALIGSALSRRTGFPFDPLALSRIRGKVPQARLPAGSRRDNVEGAFRAPRRRKVPASVLLLDDVYTSGATVDACARALKSAGAASTVVVTVARAVP